MSRQIARTPFRSGAQGFDGSQLNQRHFGHTAGGGDGSRGVRLIDVVAQASWQHRSELVTNVAPVSKTIHSTWAEPLGPSMLTHSNTTESICQRQHYRTTAIPGSISGPEYANATRYLFMTVWQPPRPRSRLTECATSLPKSLSPLTSVVSRSTTSTATHSPGYSSIMSSHSLHLHISASPMSQDTITATTAHSPARPVAPNTQLAN